MKIYILNSLTLATTVLMLPLTKQNRFFGSATVMKWTPR